MATEYYLGKGKLQIADRDANGAPGALTDVGEVPLISIEVTKDYAENFATSGEENVQDAHVPTKRTVKASITLKEASAKNLELILHGKKTANSGGSVTNQAFPSGIVAGETHRLPGFAGIASSIAITDSAGSPVTLVEGTNYTVDADYGDVKFILVTGFTQPFKAAFTNAASTRVSILSKRVSNKFLRFKGINIGNNSGKKKMLAELYDCSLMPAKKVDLKGDEHATYEVEIVLLADSTKAESEELGRYGNVLLLD
ncbi:MAG TPA: hypothetical protein VGB76_20765 [Pyrinomonadaceae bacterium]|jgi:hypothetical protein